MGGKSTTHWQEAKGKVMSYVSYLSHTLKINCLTRTLGWTTVWAVWSCLYCVVAFSVSVGVGRVLLYTFWTQQANHILCTCSNTQQPKEPRVVQPATHVVSSAPTQAFLSNSRRRIVFWNPRLAPLQQWTLKETALVSSRTHGGANAHQLCGMGFCNYRPDAPPFLV